MERTKLIEQLRKEEKKTRAMSLESSPLKQYYNGVADGLKVAIEMIENNDKK
jgi:hypothetical protein